MSDVPSLDEVLDDLQRNPPESQGGPMSWKLDRGADGATWLRLRTVAIRTDQVAMVRGGCRLSEVIESTGGPMVGSIAAVEVVLLAGETVALAVPDHAQGALLDALTFRFDDPLKGGVLVPREYTPPRSGAEAEAMLRRMP